MDLPEAICCSHGCKLKVENIINVDNTKKIYTCCIHYGVFLNH